MDCPRPITVECSFKADTITNTFVHKYMEHEGWGYTQFGEKTRLFENGDMVLKVKLSVKFTMENKVPHIVTLLDEDRFKDFIICVEDKEIKVHKCVLAVASTEFAAMLKPERKELQEGRVTIEDFDYETVMAAVELIYKRNFNRNWEHTKLLKLYKFFTKYGMNDAIWSCLIIEKINSVGDLSDNCEDVQNAFKHLFCCKRF
uniref:BTB domain-containing protein n=1 Tax=Panagrolaimus sp. JU765 TaxID=591449 RepID=A0AC34R4D3_9BILA